MLKEYITRRTVLQKMLKESFIQKENDTRWKYVSIYKEIKGNQNYIFLCFLISIKLIKCV